jgi:hypothetical protein
MKISNKDQFLIDRETKHVSNEVIHKKSKITSQKDAFFESREEANTVFQKINNLNNLNNGSD